MSLTLAQHQAITARGNVLLIAGAGTGKTHTMVERCLACLLDPEDPASLDEILMVTFTEAAAAEMRQRIRTRLEKELRAPPDGKSQRDEPRLREQLALFDAAHIGTLHSFCLRLLRQHFYKLELDPQLAVMQEEETRLLADETLGELLRKHYAGDGDEAIAVQELIQVHGKGRDSVIRSLVMRLHHYTQTQPDPMGWIQTQLDLFAAPEPALWREWLARALADWRKQFGSRVEGMKENGMAAACAAILKKLPANASRAAFADALDEIVATCENWPRGKKTTWMAPLKTLLAEAAFLASVAGTAKMPDDPPDSGEPESDDPLTQDWNWVRPQMTALLRLAREFTVEFSDAKRELGMVDFHDLEQNALQLLRDCATGQPTSVALQWRKKLRFVFVDEYQDINAAQDKIIELLSRDGPQANRFLVGDVKQSIYRFRLANPAIFQGYMAAWNQGNGQGQAIPLVENFRSRESILDGINRIFRVIMRRDIGGVEYDDQAALRFGARDARKPLGHENDNGPCVELHWRAKTNARSTAEDDGDAEAEAQVEGLAEAEKEARLVALRLLELKTQGQLIWDESLKDFRRGTWRDMAILLRAPSNKSESYAKEFARLGIPLLASRGGFYESSEISDLISLLQLLDNPLQDLPTLAVLHSPLVGLSLDELATIRLTGKGGFWTALNRFSEPRSGGEDSKAIPAETLRKVRRFLERFNRWRRLARQASVSRCLETVLLETHYSDWLLTQPRGEPRAANVQRLVSLARQFDQFQRQGLFRFLRFAEAQQLAETEPESALPSQDDAVRLLSIHQSKGLEFPVVVVADLGKPFNRLDLNDDMILDEEFGLCPKIKPEPPRAGPRYPSLPHWLAKQRQMREMLGEELRLLYVAMTRARDLLILSGAVPQKKLDGFEAAGEDVRLEDLLSARCYADWVGAWFSQQGGASGGSGVRWVVHDTAKLLETPGTQDPAGERGPLDPANAPLDPAAWQALQNRLAWQYPHPAATYEPAKTSVSILRRRAEADEIETAANLFPPAHPGPARDSRLRPPSRFPRAEDTTALDIGMAHHEFLQLVSLDRLGSAEELRAEALRLRSEGAMDENAVVGLDFKALTAFWSSEVGRKIRAQSRYIHRELEFTARFSPPELAAIIGRKPEPGMDDELVVVQGVADLVVLLPKEIWLLDYKTEAVSRDSLDQRVKGHTPQIKLYAQALSRIYSRPVSNAWLYFLAPQTAVRIELD